MSFYDGCSDQKECFGLQQGCINYKNCDFVSSFQFSERYLEIKLRHNKTENSMYIAIAFSDDQKMGNDLVFACSPSWGSKAAVKVFWNQKWDCYSEILHGQQDLIKDPYSTLEDSNFSCIFSLDKLVTVKGKRFEFECGYHILLATGQVNGAKIEYHKEKTASTSTFKTSKLRIYFL